MSQSRRKFFKNYCFSGTVSLIEDVQKSFKEAVSNADYFDSYETSYPLISEYSYYLEDEIKELGINTKGKSTLEIVEAVYEKKGRDKFRLSDLG